MRPAKKGNAFAGVLLIVCLVLLVAFLAYVTSVPVEAPIKGEKTYFENLDFALGTGKIWHVGVPVAFDGKLHLSFTSNDSIRVYAKTNSGYVLDSVSIGRGDYLFRVTVSMGIVEVGLMNTSNKIVLISELTCVLAQQT
jgi:hypothetical protein